MEQVMRKKLYSYILLCCTVLVLISCVRDNSFVEFDDPYISYEIYPGKQDIIRIVRTDMNGSYSLQLFDKYGDLMESLKIGTPYTFIIKKCEADTLELSYVVSSSDLELDFLPWFRNYKDNPKKLGHYRLTYSYTIQNMFVAPQDITIDSLFVVQKDKTVNFFLKNTIIDSKPIRSLYVYNNCFTHLDDSTKLLYRYVPKDTTLVKKYLQGIVQSLK